MLVLSHRFLFLFVVFVFTFFPASFFIEIKLFSVFILLYLSISKRVILKNYILLAVFILGWLCFSFLQSYMIYEYDFIFAAKATISYLLVILTSILFLNAYDRLEIDLSTLLRVFVFGVFSYCVLKLTFVFMPFYSGLSVREVAGLISSNAAIDFKSENQLFLRIGTSTDLMLPFGLYLCFFSKNLKLGIKPIFKWLSIFIFVLTLVLNLTRYLWIVLFLISAIYFFREKLYLKPLVLVVLTAIILFSYPYLDQLIVYEEIIARFNDTASLDMKSLQSKFLLEGFVKAPIFGSGSGSYVMSLIRSPKLPYMYETQLISFLYQFGLVGSSIILFLFILPIQSFLSYTFNKRKVRPDIFFFVIIYILFLLSGFTNPNLTNLNTSLVYFIVMVLCKYYGKKKCNE